MAIIDGKSVFYRGYYAMPNLSTKDGTPTGGVYGFAAMGLELIKRLKPDYVCVAWDKPKTNIRRRLELYPQYKANRKPPPADFYAQIPILHELLDAFSWPLYELDDYEADDIMGALAVQAREKDVETMLITSDLDMLQLINGHVKVYALKKGFSQIEEYHPESFEQKYGISHEQFLDLKSLKGDSSDNIPGVPGIGEKTAITLLQEYKTLDGVYENVDLVKESVAKKLIAGKESAYLSKEIARIWTDAPVPLDLPAMDGTNIDTARLAEMLRKLEFRSLLRQLPQNMQGDVPEVDTIAGSELKLPKMTIIDKQSTLAKLDFSKAKELVIHSRSAGKHGKNPQYLLLQPDGGEAYVINLAKISPKQFFDHMSPVLFNSKLKLVGFNIKNDIKVLYELLCDYPYNVFDVQNGAFLLNCLVRSQTLTDLATEGIGFEGSSFESLPDEDFVQRAPEILAVISELYKKQSADIKDIPRLETMANEVEWPVVPVLAAMEYQGIKLDGKYLKKFSKELEGLISDYEEQIYGHADFEFNIGSPSQLADVLFTKLGLPTEFIKKGKTGYSTAASELDKLRGVHPIINLITQFREVTKLKNTYVDTLPEMVDENDRLHTTFNMTMAQTGRLSSIDPNLQNIPVRTDLGKRIRTAFVAGNKNVFVSGDYSQFELRLAAVLSGDKELIELFNEDADIHVMTAAAVHGIKPEDVTKQQRYEAKAVNFGILYGQGPHGLAVGTGMTFADARDFIKRYFEIRPKFKEYIESTRKKAEEQGYVETLLGRRRPTPDVKSSNFAVREAAFRAAINMPVQGTAADLTKLAMTAISKKLGEGMHQLLQIHDSILVECHEDQATGVEKILKETMESVYELPVKLKVDVSTGKNWGEL